MSLLTVPGAQLRYEVSGSGPHLILIPGASGTGESFRQLPAHLSVHYQVVIVEVFHGASLTGLKTMYTGSRPMLMMFDA